MNLREKVIKVLQPYIEVDPATEHEWPVAQRYNAGLALDAILDTLSENAEEWGDIGVCDYQGQPVPRAMINKRLIAALRDTETEPQ